MSEEREQSFPLAETGAFSVLPLEMQLEVLSFLDLPTLLRVMPLVNSYWHQLSNGLAVQNKLIEAKVVEGKLWWYAYTYALSKKQENEVNQLLSGYVKEVFGLSFPPGKVPTLLKNLFNLFVEGKQHYAKKPEKQAARKQYLGELTAEGFIAALQAHIEALRAEIKTKNLSLSNGKLLIVDDGASQAMMVLKELRALEHTFATIIVFEALVKAFRAGHIARNKTDEITVCTQTRGANHVDANGIMILDATFNFMEFAHDEWTETRELLLKDPKSVTEKKAARFYQLQTWFEGLTESHVLQHLELEDYDLLTHPIFLSKLSDRTVLQSTLEVMASDILPLFQHAEYRRRLILIAATSKIPLQDIFTGVMDNALMWEGECLHDESEEAKEDDFDPTEKKPYFAQAFLSCPEFTTADVLSDAQLVALCKALSPFTFLRKALAVNPQLVERFSTHLHLVRELITYHKYFAAALFDSPHIRQTLPLEDVVWLSTANFNAKLLILQDDELSKRFTAKHLRMLKWGWSDWAESQVPGLMERRWEALRKRNEEVEVRRRQARWVFIKKPCGKNRLKRFGNVLQRVILQPLKYWWHLMTEGSITLSTTCYLLNM